VRTAAKLAHEWIIATRVQNYEVHAIVRVEHLLGNQIDVDGFDPNLCFLFKMSIGRYEVVLAL
jgi:hypothetical protein